MKILQVLTHLREQKLSESKKKSIVEFGAGFEYAGSVYKAVGTACELVGKALQTPETANEIFQCMEDVKNRVLDTATMIVCKNRVAFEQVESSIDNINQAAESLEEKAARSFAESAQEEHEDFNEDTEDDYSARA